MPPPNALCARAGCGIGGAGGRRRGGGGAAARRCAPTGGAGRSGAAAARWAGAERAGRQRGRPRRRRAEPRSARAPSGDGRRARRGPARPRARAAPGSRSRCTNPAPAPSHEPAPRVRDASLASAGAGRRRLARRQTRRGRDGRRRRRGPAHAAGAGAIGAIGGNGGSKSTASVLLVMFASAFPEPDAGGTRVEAPRLGGVFPSPGPAAGAGPGVFLSASVSFFGVGTGFLGAGTSFGSAGFLAVRVLCAASLGAGTGAARGCGMVFTSPARGRRGSAPSLPGASFRPRWSGARTGVARLVSSFGPLGAPSRGFRPPPRLAAPRLLRLRLLRPPALPFLPPRPLRQRARLLLHLRRARVLDERLQFAAIGIPPPPRAPPRAGAAWLSFSALAAARRSASAARSAAARDGPERSPSRSGLGSQRRLGFARTRASAWARSRPHARRTMRHGRAPGRRVAVPAHPTISNARGKLENGGAALRPAATLGGGTPASGRGGAALTPRERVREHAPLAARGGRLSTSRPARRPPRTPPPSSWRTRSCLEAPSPGRRRRRDRARPRDAKRGGKPALVRVSRLPSSTCSHDVSLRSRKRGPRPGPRYARLERCFPPRESAPALSEDLV